MVNGLGLTLLPRRELGYAPTATLRLRASAKLVVSFVQNSTVVVVQSASSTGGAWAIAISFHSRLTIRLIVRLLSRVPAELPHLPSLTPQLTGSLIEYAPR